MIEYDFDILNWQDLVLQRLNLKENETYRG